MQSDGVYSLTKGPAVAYTHVSLGWCWFAGPPAFARLATHFHVGQLARVQTFREIAERLC